MLKNKLLEVVLDHNLPSFCNWTHSIPITKA